MKLFDFFSCAEVITKSLERTQSYMEASIWTQESRRKMIQHDQMIKQEFFNCIFGTMYFASLPTFFFHCAKLQKILLEKF